MTAEQARIGGEIGKSMDKKTGKIKSMVLSVEKLQRNENYTGYATFNTSSGLLNQKL